MFLIQANFDIIYTALLFLAFDLIITIYTVQMRKNKLVESIVS